VMRRGTSINSLLGAGLPARGLILGLASGAMMFYLFA
jgi:hypothetical protein